MGYKQLRKLGHGSYGAVYLARDDAQRYVVVKRVELTLLKPPQRRAAFDESKLLRNLNHPYICGFKDSFVDTKTNQLCIVMTYCDGGDLHRRIKRLRQRNQTLPEAKIVGWLLQLTLALEYMHDRKHVIHRDLKTQNVFLMADDTAKLGDFGVSRVLESPADLARTCVGTPFYMCPELMRKQKYSSKADMWALGCILYELSTLRHAFDARDMRGLAMKIVRGKYPPVSDKYSRALRSIIDELLATAPESRPSAAELLNRPLLRERLAAEPVVPEEPPASEAPRPSVAQARQKLPESVAKRAQQGGVVPYARGGAAPTPRVPPRALALRRGLELPVWREMLALLRANRRGSEKSWPFVHKRICSRRCKNFCVTRGHHL